MENSTLISQLFRTEYRKIVSVLIKHVGFDQVEIAEDIAGDTFLRATETWQTQGAPANPVAWLYLVAKRLASNYLHRNGIFDKKISPALQRDLRQAAEESTNRPTGDELDLSPQNINDSQLQMMFAICHPSIPPEAQIGLSLRILCGFSIEEIADAFLTNKETINKRLFRAKERLRQEKIKIEPLPANSIDDRLPIVLTTIYLLFSEGYYSISQNTTLREELCVEAMRLCHMLVENQDTNKPQVNALLSLMCFHASRFAARRDQYGELILYSDQDTTLWNTDMISRGAYFLHCSANGKNLSRYHLEAVIAYWNTQRADTKEKWERILQAYNQLLQIAYSPIAALNRTYALSRANGKQEAIAAAEKLQLTDNHFYYTLLGELYMDLDNERSEQHFKRALTLAKTTADKQTIQKWLDKLSPP